MALRGRSVWFRGPFEVGVVLASEDRPATGGVDVTTRTLERTDRLSGPEHPDTLNARGNLAASYHSAGRSTEAITFQEQVADSR